MTIQRLLIAASLGFMSITAHATEIGISAQDTYLKVQGADAKVLFVDVRDPVEIMFVGFTVLFAYLAVQKWRIESVKDILADRELDALSRPATARAARNTDQPAVAGGSED